MKLMRTIILIILLLFVFSALKTYSQKEVVNYLDVGVANANVLSDQYLYPYAGMIDATLLGGWNKAPRVQRVGKFTVHAFLNQGFRESTDNLMNIGDMINSGELSSVTLVNPAISNAPTAPYKLKTGQERPILLYQGNQVEVPNGDDMGSIQLPALSFSIGLPAAMELMVKLTPPLDYSNLGETMLWGVGIKHSLKDYLALFRNTPYIEAALLANYSSLNTDNEVSYKSQKGQRLISKGSAASGHLLLGLHFNKADIYGSVGYGLRNHNFRLSGTFSEVPDGEGGVVAVKDPVEIDYDFSGLEYEVGLQIRLYFLNLQAGYALSNYSMVSVGAGISF